MTSKHQKIAEGHSCLQIKQKHKNYPSGYYQINIEGNSVSAYCDMDTDEGKLNGKLF